MEQDIQHEQSNSFIDAIRQRHKEEKQKLNALHEQIRLIETQTKIVEQNLIAYERVIQIELEKQPEYLVRDNSFHITDNRAEYEQDIRDEYDDEETQEEVNLDYFENGYSSSDPMDMLRPRFKGLSLNEVALAILEESGIPMTIQEVAEVAYDTKIEEGFKRAKGSISATLRNGINEDDISKSLWLKTKRGVYVKKSYYTSTKKNKEQYVHEDVTDESSSSARIVFKETQISPEYIRNNPYKS